MTEKEHDVDYTDPEESKEKKVRSSQTLIIIY
jgi:hypothetical protein